jgi:hypothetical protein
VSAIARESQAFLRTGVVPSAGGLVRIVVFLHRARLDAELAAGANPLHSPASALRARQLRNPLTRARLATAIERAVKLARRPPRASVVVAPCRLDSVAERDLLTIAFRLRCSPPVEERAVAIVSALVTDGAGPLYNPAASHRLRDRVELALRWLERTS